MTAPALGQAIPDFSAPATSGQTITLSSLRGRHVILYFYPKDSTPGCTQEGQDFRDLHAEFQQLDAVILGVSRDSLKSHENFKCKQEFLTKPKVKAAEDCRRARYKQLHR